jgi:hypothetical protein
MDRERRIPSTGSLKNSEGGSSKIGGGRMSLTAQVADEGEDSRVLWRAILRFDDVEIADQLFWLVAHERMQPHETAAAKHALTPTTLEVYIQSFLVPEFFPFGIAAFSLIASLITFILSVASKELFLLLFSLFIFLYSLVWLFITRLTRNPTTTVSISRDATWEQCLAQHPDLLRRLRRRGHLHGVWPPSDTELAGAIQRQLDNYPRVADPRDAEPTNPSGSRLEKIAEFTKMASRFPGHVPPSAIPDWVSQLGDKDWKNRFNARLVVRAVGIDALPDLWRAKQRNHARRVSKRLIRIVIQDNQSHIAKPAQFVCTACFTRFHMFRYAWDIEPHRAVKILGGPEKDRYSACRTCKSARHARTTSLIVCVVGRSNAFDSSNNAIATSTSDRLLFEHSRTGEEPPSSLKRAIDDPKSPPSAIAVPWSIARRPFDFDAVHVGQAEDWEIEQFATALLADEDRVRLRCRPRVAVQVDFPDQLSALRELPEHSLAIVSPCL